MGGSVATCIDGRKAAAVGGNLLAFPADTEMRFRLLLREVCDFLAHADGLRVLVERIGFASRTMYVDDYACVFTGVSVSDFHFSLDTREGRRILLITGDIAVMARFIAGYLISRHEGRPELAIQL